MSIGNTGVGGCSAILHLVVQYPKIAACATILGVSVTSLTPSDMVACDEKIAQCRGVTPVVPTPAPQRVETIVPATAVATVQKVPEPAVLVPAVLPPDPCAGAPVITDADLYKVTGPVHLWKRSGVDPVRGHAPQPFLQKLQYTPEQQAYFLGEIANGGGTMGTLQNGTRMGTSTSGSGKLMYNVVVAFNPIPQTGDNHTRDNRMRTYTYERKAVYNGQCVTHRVTLLEPQVCQNWSRPSDEIIADAPPPVVPALQNTKKE